MLLALSLALLVAQSISTLLLYRAGESRREQTVLNAAAFRLVSPPQTKWRRPKWGTHQGSAEAGKQAKAAQRLPHFLRVEHTDKSPLLAGEASDPRKEALLREILAAQSIEIGELVVLSRPIARDMPSHLRKRLRHEFGQRRGQRINLLVAATRDAPGEKWTIVRVAEPPRQRGAFENILLQTGLIFLFLVGLQFLLLRRITRPLKMLTARTERFARTQDPADPITPEGPEDIRRLIAAHNAMEDRIGALLDEKDVMLGAIGHDLKTPLAALRVRIESVEDTRERGRMAASIEDITRSLDDILSLARVGRVKDAPDRAELSALAASVVEEFEDMGQPVTLASASRIVHSVHVTWLRRALRNLIANAVRYGGSAHVSLLQTDKDIVLRVEDSGPGIAAGQIETMLEPFTRGEISRNRDTGGAGLGLTLARAIADQHGGHLVLANRIEGGLRAEIRLPRA